MNIQPVLRCRLCNKPFDKESTLRRHGYYCRSRNTSRTTRARSCTACAESKARCDNVRPTCSRCATRNIACNYPTPQPKSSRAVVRLGGDELAHSRQDGSLALVRETSGQSVHKLAASSDGTDGPLDIKAYDAVVTGSVWNDFDFEFFNSFTEQKMNTVSNKPSLGDFTAPWLRQASIPSSIPFNVRSLIQRPKMKTGGQTTAKLMFHNLQSYPLMLLRQNVLPPFIHPSLITATSLNDSMEPFHNCINLMHMISKGLPGSRKLFWRNVRLECERMCEEYLTFDRWKLLAAMQALSIYILVRLHEGETEYNDFEPLLLTAVTLIAKQTSYNDEMNAAKRKDTNFDLVASWRDWIYEESKQRICVVYQVINMLVYFEPAMLCDLQTDLVLAPLPSRRQLWEAPDEITWGLEKEKERDTQTVYGLAANGQLVNLAQGVMSCSEALWSYSAWDEKTSSRPTADWGEWCAEMDGLGGLVMLAASLHE